MLLLTWLIRSVPWVGAAVCASLLLNAMLGQVAIQEDLNEAMQRVLVSIRESGRLTRATADGLRPLAETADVTERMNVRLQGAIEDLVEVNSALRRVAAQQDQVIEGLDRLNYRTWQVALSLEELDRENQAILAANRTLTSRTEEQAGAMETLVRLTGESTAYMARMNRRFAFLR